MSVVDRGTAPWPYRPDPTRDPHEERPPPAPPTLRVLQVINTLSVSYGGPVHNSFGLHRGLNRCAHTESVLVSVGRSAPDDVVRDGPTEHVRLGERGRLRQLVRDADVVVIHGYYFAWTVLLAVWCRLTSTPYVLTPHGSLTAFHRRKSVAKKRVFESLGGGWFRRGARVVVVGSEDEARELAAFDPTLSIVVGGAGTDVSVPPRPARRRGGPLALLSMSRIDAKKRIDVTIRALARLRELGHDAVLRVAGDGDGRLAEDLASLARSLGVHEHVHFLGQVVGAEKERVYEQSDVFVLPSENENFGIALAEAMARGLPCVVTRAVAASAVMSPEAGRRVERADAHLVARAVADIVDTGLQAAGEAARADATAHFDWTSVALRWRGILARVVG